MIPNNKNLAHTVAVIYLYAFPSLSVAQPDSGLLDSLLKNNLIPIKVTSNELRNDPNQNYLAKVALFQADGESGRTINYYIDQRESDTEPPALSPMPERCYATPADTIAILPIIYVPFYYANAYLYRASQVFYFSLYFYWKNYGDSSWYVGDGRKIIRIYDRQGMVREARLYSRDLHSEKHEGFTSAILHNMEMRGAKLWSHTNPYLYYYFVELPDNQGRLVQAFHEKFGFRGIRYINRELVINKHQVPLKILEIDHQNIPQQTEGLSEYLRSIKVHNFNAVLLKEKAGRELFDYCDSLGLYVIQEVSDVVFPSIPSLMDYFTQKKEHPSFIAWLDSGLAPHLLNILTRIDYMRPVIKNLSYPIIKNWNSLDSLERLRIKQEFQVFHFYFIPESKKVLVDLDEEFLHANELVLEWKVVFDDGSEEGGRVTDILFEKNHAEIELSFDRNEKYTVFECKLIVNKDCYQYRKGEVVATTTVYLSDN